MGLMYAAGLSPFSFMQLIVKERLEHLNNGYYTSVNHILPIDGHQIQNRGNYITH